MYRITTPATTANMGPGFDCIGMAFQLYNTLWVEETDEKLNIELTPPSAGFEPFEIPTDEGNLIYQTIRGFYQEIDQIMPGIHMIQKDRIPLTRGLGSSAACIVSGLMAANALSGAALGREDLIQMAARLEGHPDNVAPAFLGGAVVGAMADGRLSYCPLSAPALSRLRFSVMIPNFTLSTEKAREALPDRYSREDAVFNASRTALLTASLLTGRFDLLKTAMADRIHQPYRMRIIPGMKEIFEECERKEALSVFLSGAGPTLIAVTEKETEDFQPELPPGWELRPLAPDWTGAAILTDDIFN